MKDLYEELSKKRKLTQEQGLTPEWYSTAGFQMFSDKYLYGTDSIKGQFERIASTAAKHLSHIGFEEQAKQKFFNLFWEGKLSPSTPVLSNMGTDRGMPVSCSGGVIHDSIDGFYSSLHEVAMLTKNGFGTSSDLSSIRPRGSKISVGGKSSGVLPVFKMHVQAMRDVAQGTARRGAWAGYIDIEHGDFDEVADYILAEPDDANIGWILHDSFIQRLDNGDADAIRRYQKALKIKMVLGKGYFCCIDKINRKVPQMYKDKGMTVKASNLCVSPETLILTRQGYQQISTLENEMVDIWNGVEWSNVLVKKTGENQKLLKVVTNSGFELECTPYHKFYVAVRHPTSGNTKIHEKRAHELVEGDKLIKCNFPIIDGTQNLDYAYDNGFFSADGCYTPQGSRVYLYGEKIKLKSYLSDIYGKWTIQPEHNREYAHTDKLQPKYFVPLNEYTVQSRLDWFAGLCDGDGTVARNGNTQSIQVGSIHKNFLLEVQMMLQTVGVSSKVTKAKDAGYRKMPLNDGTGLSGDFYCQDSYRLLIGQTGIATLQDLGFKTNRLELTNHRANRECEQFVKIVSVEDNGRFDDTYCFTEPNRHMGVFNGLLTGNCDEITLFADEEHTFTCVLSSINVSNWDSITDDDIFWATVFLDCVAEEFIHKAKGISGLEKAVRFTEKGRALGLGQCGFHTYLQNHMIAFESLEAHMLSSKIAKRIYDVSLEASKWMADKLGEPEWCKGYGVRNTHRIAIAPTKSTAVLMGGVSEGINPDPAMVYTQMTAGGEVERVNPALLKIMKERNKFTKKVISDLKDKMGSVQHVDWLSEEEKQVFKTAFEINQEAIIRMASVRGKFIDQWQSLNLFFSAEESEEVVSGVHQIALQDENILGLYYVYSSSGVKASNGECIACS